MKEKIEQHFSGRWQLFYEKYLTQVKRQGGDEYQALCPFHDDQKPSLNFNSVKGTYLCRSCGKKGHAFHLYAKLHDLDDRRDFPKILKGIASDFGIEQAEVKAHVVKTYSYVDEQGVELFQVCRMEPKAFRQRHRVGDKWQWDLKGVRRVLYNLPSVIKADEVIIVEGEKDCDALAEIGFPATTNHMGAGKWADEYTEFLKGKNIVLIPDNDQPGREHMLRVAQSLQGHAKSIKWLDLPDMPSKGDASDYIATFPEKDAAAERLAVMIDSAETYEPPKPVTMHDMVFEAGDFCRLVLPDKRVIIDPWLAEASIILISGMRGVGKSWFAISLLDCITAGKDFGPWKVLNCVPCLYYDAEMTGQDTQSRLKIINPRNGVEDFRQSPLYILSDHTLVSKGLPRGSLLSEAWRDKVESILKAKHVKVFVLDNLASLSPGVDENSKKENDPINQWLVNLRFAGITTIELHHTGKGGAQRGTSAREDHVDMSLLLKYPKDYEAGDGASFVCHFSKARVGREGLGKIADTEWRLNYNDDGSAYWTHKGVKEAARNMILRLLDEGIGQTEVAEQVGHHRSWVNRIRSEAISKGWLTAKNKLTQSGYMVIAE